MPVDDLTPAEREAVEMLRSNDPRAAERLTQLGDSSRSRVLPHVVKQPPTLSAMGEARRGRARDSMTPPAAGSSPPDTESTRTTRRSRIRGKRRSEHPEEIASEPARRRRQRILRVSAVMLLVAGSAMAGAVVGWWVRDAQSEALAPLNIEAVIDRPVAVVGPRNAPLGQMPAVLGLPIDQARRVLFDSGVLVGAITVTQRPTALEPGVVLLQDPPAGSALADGVSLVVSTETVVPDLVGMTLENAQDLLTDLGAKPTIKPRLDGGVAPGIVLGSQPAAGKPLKRAIVLEVSFR